MNPAVHIIDPDFYQLSAIDQAPHYGTTEEATKESLLTSKYCHRFPQKNILLIHGPKEELTKDKYFIDPFKGNGAITIYTPSITSRKERRFFKNGHADEITTTFGSIYLQNFNCKSVNFIDPKGNPIKGRVFLDKNSKIENPVNTLAEIILLKKNTPRKKKRPVDKS